MSDEEKEVRRLEINARKRELYILNRESVIERKRVQRLNNIEKERARYRKYDLEHREQRKLASKTRYVPNPRKLIPKDEQMLRAKIKRGENYLKNKDLILERNSMYRKNNPGKINARNNKRRARELQATPTWLTTFDLDYMEHLYIQAKELEKLDGIKYHVDHEIPLQGRTVCGLHVPWNLQILEASVNLSKSNKVL